MPTKRHFNWKLAIVLAIGLFVLSIVAFGLRRWQRSNRAEVGLILGNKAYNEHRWEEAAKYLGRYIAINRDDVPALLKYADAQLNIRPLQLNNIKQAESAWRTVLRIDKGNSEAALKLVKNYVQLGMPGEAELIARRHLETIQDPELRRMLALALVGQRKFSEATTELKTVCSENPQYILAYETLGQLTEQRPEVLSEPPGYWFNQAVKNNPSAALAYIIRAGYYLRSEDNPKALSDLELAEEQDLSDSAVRLRLSKEFINSNALDKAEHHLAAVQIAEPANQVLWQTWAQLALKSNSKEKMINIAETGLEELSAQPWDFMPTATELFISSGQLDRATDCISMLRSKNITPTLAAFLEGLIAERKGQLYEAIDCWNRSIELGNESSQIRLAIASTLSRLGNTQSAIRQLRISVSLRPDIFEGHLALARLLAQVNNWAEAAEQARIANQISPDSLDAAVLYLQAQIQLLSAHSSFPGQENAQRLEDIERQLVKLQNINNGALKVKLLQLQLAIQQGNFTNAEMLLTQLKKAHPSQVGIALAEAELLAAQEKTDEAISKLNDTIKEFPEAVGPVRHLALLLALQDKPEECEKILQDALKRIEEPVSQQQLCLLLADLYSRWGKEEKAYKLLASLTGKLPNDIPIKRRLLKCKQAIENIEKAQEIVNDIKSLDGDSGWQWRYEQARLWFISDDFENRYPQIISLLQENILDDPDDQESRMLLASSYERSGELQLAISTYHNALNRSPDDVRIIISTIAALYKAKEYVKADEILNSVSKRELYHPELQKLQLQSYLRRGQLSSASDILQDLISNEPDNQAASLFLALLKIRQGNFAEAEKLLTTLKSQDPNSLPVTYAQIQLNIRQDKPEEALRLCNEIVNNLENASSYILRARTHTTLQQSNKAIEDLELATAIEPNNIEVWVARSQFYRSIGQPDQAIADIQQALSLASSNVQIQKLAISLYLASDNPNIIRQGRTILNDALESNPDDIELRLFKARSLLAEGTAPAIENAQQILQKITEEGPEVTDAWALLSEIAFRQGESSKAIDIALRGLVHRPNDKTLLLLKARSEAEKLPALAIPTLKALREIDPEDVDIIVNLANTYLAADQPQKAVNLIKTQLDRGTSDKRSLNIAFAVALHKNGNKKEAQKEFDSLFLSEPNDPRPLLAQAKLLKDDEHWTKLSQKVLEWYLKHPEDKHTPVTIARDLIATENNQAQKSTEEILRTVLKNEPDYTEAMVTLAVLLQINDRADESTALYQKVLMIEPDNLIAINNLAWIFCEKQGKHQQALELAKKGLKLAPRYIDLIDTRGVAYYRLGEFNKAIQDFNTCIKLYSSSTPPYVASQFHLGRAYAKLGQTDMAIEHLNQVLELEKRIGGLSRTDLAEVQHLINELSQGG